MTTTTLKTVKAPRWAKRVGSWLATAEAVGSGYAWGRYGLLCGAAVYVGCLVVALAVYGASRYPWGENE